MTVPTTDTAVQLFACSDCGSRNIHAIMIAPPLPIIPHDNVWYVTLERAGDVRSYWVHGLNREHAVTRARELLMLEGGTNVHEYATGSTNRDHTAHLYVRREGRA